MSWVALETGQPPLLYSCLGSPISGKWVQKSGSAGQRGLGVNVFDWNTRHRSKTFQRERIWAFSNWPIWLRCAFANHLGEKLKNCWCLTQRREERKTQGHGPSQEGSAIMCVHMRRPLCGARGPRSPGAPVSLLREVTNSSSSTRVLKQTFFSTAVSISEGLKICETDSIAGGRQEEANLGCCFHHYILKSKLSCEECVGDASFKMGEDQDSDGDQRNWNEGHTELSINNSKDQ